MEKRIFSLDLLRVFACYLVIHQHASEFFYIGEGGRALVGDHTFQVGIITSLARASVPLFVMISGYLLLPNQISTSDFLKKRFTRILYPFVVWCVLYACYYIIYRGDSLYQAVINIGHIPVNFGVEVGHLWYIYMLIGLYLVIPVISPWLSLCSKKTLKGYLILWSFTTFLPYLHLVYPQMLGECFWNPTPAFYYFNGFIGYLLLGYYIKKYGALSFISAFVAMIVGYAVTSGIFCMRADNGLMVEKLELSWGFCTFNVALLAYGIFSMFMRITVKCEGKTECFFRKISLKTYGIYLAHIMILNVFYNVFQPLSQNIWIAIPLIAFCTLVVTYVLISLLAKLPYSKYWLG